MKCDNYETCRGDTDRAPSQARVKGWHMFEGTTHGGDFVTWVLCPACVGQRAHGPRAPEVLEGQEELF